MDKKEKLLNEINMCARIALTSYTEFKGHVCCEELKKELEREEAYYTDLLSKSKKLLGEDIPSNSMSAFQKMGMKMKLMMNKHDDGIIAEMLIKGNEMGFLAVNKAYNRNGELQSEVNDLTTSLLNEFDISRKNLGKFL